MMANDAASASAENAVMSRKVPCHATNRRAPQAPRRVCRRKPAGSHEKGKGCRQYELHLRFLRGTRFDSWCR